ncbi:MAG: tetratricopeptide repeat protein, partial [Nitrospira sp.]|nr:tetratricopeptide repeat protein [Nitrospira sp.]
MESPEPAGPPLPDEGPRVEGGLHEQGILDLTWQEGQAAYKKAAWGEAKRLFEKLSRDYPKSAYIPGALAFLAEIALRDDASVRDRASAIQIYKTVVRDYPDSPNGRRAQWRIADLYLERGWLPEAQASYERSMGQSRQYPDDHNRAMLGLGYTFMAMQKWRDAEHTFMTLRKRSEQSLLSRYAAVGLAHAMYRQGRMMEAHAFYELSYRGWPVLFRRDPQAIYRYAMTQMAIHRDASAQEVLLLLYNLYPRDEHAPDALLQVAEHMAMTSQLSQAQFFYALIPSLYPNSTHSAMATMRMAVLRVEHMAQTDVNRVDVTVRAMMHNVSMPDLTGEAYRTLLQGIVAQLSNSPMGNEALVHLGKYYERTSETEQAMQAYKEAVQRAVHADNPWAVQASGRFSTLLTPVIDEAVKSHDDLAVVSLFHRYGPSAERVYAQSPLMLDIAEAHRRLGFALEAGRLYQHLTRVKDVSVLETALVGLGKSYLDQQDPHAARKVLERYRFQFQDGRYESEVLHLLVGAMRRQEDLQGMLRLCRQWLIHHPKHRDRSYMYLQLAETLRRLEKFEESVAAYEAAFNAGGQPSIDTILAYAGTLSRMNLHERAIAAYQAALDQAPTVRQAEWIHLQAAKHWNALKQYDRATV